jgi:hypothetical protein
MNDWDKIKQRLTATRQAKQKSDRKKIVLVAIVLLVVIFGLIAFVKNTAPSVLAVQAPALAPTRAPLSGAIVPFPVTCFEEAFGDPEPMTMNERPRMSDEDRARAVLIGRLARGIRKIGLAKGGGRWWECGEVYDDTNENEAAFEWAYRIVTLAWEYSDVGSGNGYTMNPWEIAGVAANECGFDRCALGKYPRQWGVSARHHEAKSALHLAHVRGHREDAERPARCDAVQHLRARRCSASRALAL